MERSTIFKFGQPSISMGHLYHGYVSHNQRVHKFKSSGKPFCYNRVSLASSASLGPCCSNLPNHLIQGWQTPPGLLGLAIVAVAVAVVIIVAAAAAMATIIIDIYCCYCFLITTAISIPISTTFIMILMIMTIKEIIFMIAIFIIIILDFFPYPSFNGLV